MRYEMGQSTKNGIQDCVNEVVKNFRNPKFIIYYGDVTNFTEYTKAIYEKFPDSICMGASTYVCLTKDGAIRKGLTAVAFEDGIDVSAGVLHDANKYPLKYMDEVKKCVNDIKNHRNAICVEFTTSLLCAEESVLAVLNAVLEEYNIPLVGGSAGDDNTGEVTYVALNGQVHKNSTVFAIINNHGGAIKVYRENIYKPITGNVLVATKVDWLHREVKEYDNEPAAKVYARELGVSENEISKYFDSYPVGRLYGEDMYITANCEETSGKGMRYHARIYNNSKVVVLEPDDYREVTIRTMEKIKKENPKPSFCLMCHCLARSALFEGEGYLQEYAKYAGSMVGNYIAFSGYGEQMNKFQFNQTMTIAVFE